LSQTLSVVVPVFNESEVLETFHARLVKVMDDLGMPFQVLYVDDGSDTEFLFQLQLILLFLFQVFL
jgi:glycosyltransferase involved in cell wall biosynthesis